jgi:plasmid maintenance system antidote protein VapI
LEPALTGEELAHCLDAIDWSVRGLSRRLDVPEQTIRRMVNDQNPIPDSLAQYVRVVAAVICALDVPDLTFNDD